MESHIQDIRVLENPGAQRRIERAMSPQSWFHKRELRKWDLEATCNWDLVGVDMSLSVDDFGSTF